ncbi:unnamed protein product [Bubo scandiacus]
MWFAALGPHTSSPWFTSFVYRLLQGKEEVIRLVQGRRVPVPLQRSPPPSTSGPALQVLVHRQRPGQVSGAGPGPAPWWRRQLLHQFFPTVSLGDPTLESLLGQHGLKGQDPPQALGRRPPAAGAAGPAPAQPPLLRPHRPLVPLPGGGHHLPPTSPGPTGPGGARPPPDTKAPGGGDPADRGGGEKNGQVRRKEGKEAEEKGEGRARGAADGHGDGGRPPKKRK